MNKSTLRAAVATIALACAIAADAQQADAPTFLAPRVDASPGKAMALQFAQLAEPVRLAQATPTTALTAQPVGLPGTARWTPLLVLLGVLALIGALLLMTRPRFRRVPWESVETEESAARGRERLLARKLRTLWDEPATRPTLGPRHEPKPALAGVSP